MLNSSKIIVIACQAFFVTTFVGRNDESRLEQKDSDVCSAKASDSAIQREQRFSDGIPLWKATYQVRGNMSRPGCRGEAI